MLVKRLFNELMERWGLTGGSPAGGRPEGQPGGGRGRCSECRHANHGTLDAADGLWACPWLGATAPESPCRIRYRDSGLFVFERYDGSNGTWVAGPGIFRSVPLGYEGREVVPVQEPGEPR
jgi:hypothetical protein